MKFREYNEWPYRLISDDGRFRLGRSEKDAPLNTAFYKVSWRNDGRPYVSTVIAQEISSNGPSLFVVNFDYAELIERLQGENVKLSPSDDMELMDAIGSGICELNRVRKGIFAIDLKTKFEVVLAMPNGEQRLYRDGSRVR
jgi:hypothetical protein